MTIPPEVRRILIAKLESGDVYGFGPAGGYDDYPSEEETVDALLGALSDAGYDVVPGLLEGTEP